MTTYRPGPRRIVAERPIIKTKQRICRGRTSRACDRCRAKKAKCDGAQVCKACQASDSPCVYSARRREARNFYFQMGDMTDIAIQKLYWACRKGTGFPGVIPNESATTITTSDILKAMGLVKPNLNALHVPQELGDSPRRVHGKPAVQPFLQAIEPGTAMGSMEPQTALYSPCASSSSRLSKDRDMPSTRLSAFSPIRPAEQLNMKLEFPSQPSDGHLVPDETTETGCVVQQPVGVGSYLDMSFRTAYPPASQSSMFSSLPSLALSMSLATMPPFSPPWPNVIHDSFFSPWPSNLNTTHQPVDISSSLF